MQSKSAIRSITEKDGRFLVSFAGHDGYFTVADNEMSDFLQGMLKAAHERGEEVSFTYDAGLTITEIIV